MAKIHFVVRNEGKKMIKVMTIFGTRPEAIKMAPLVNELKLHKEIDTIVCVTAQHRQMLDQVLTTFSIMPDYDLNIMKEGQTLTEVTTNALKGLGKVMEDVRPDIVLVHGDTTTTFAGALSAFYCKIPVGHVEAGLRTYDKYSPYPEEMNRQMVSNIADIHFAPTKKSAENLINEGIDESKIYITGNTAIDAMHHTVYDSYSHDVLEWVGDSRMILLTAHRRENLGMPMKKIFRAIRQIVEDFDDVKVVYPIHLNPIIREIADVELNGCKRVKLIEPLEVVDFHNFLNNAFIIMTDSGGIEEEPPSLGKPVLVLRDTTERPEGVDAGTLKLVGTDQEKIYETAKALLTDHELYEKMSHASNPYGDGYASERIVDAILKTYE